MSNVSLPPQNVICDKNTNKLECKYYIKSTDDGELGDGNFSIVKKCENILTGDIFAMKQVHKNLLKGKLHLIHREIDLLNFISDRIREVENTSNDSNDVFQGHHHILQLFDYFETKKSIILITQLCSKIDLYELITNNNNLDLQKQVIPFTSCLISVLSFLHDNDIVHRDIKAENVLFRLNSNTNNVSAHDLILADFGLATHIKNNDNSLKEFVGTISYISPEIVKCKGISTKTIKQIDNINPYDEKIDIWALAVLVYFMTTGYTPFDCDTDIETLDCIINCDYYIDNDIKFDKKYTLFWNFIKDCLKINPSDRPSAMDLKYHPFVSKFFPSMKSRIFNSSQRPNLINRCSSTHSLRSPSKSPSYLRLYDNTISTSPTTNLFSNTSSRNITPLTQLSSSTSSTNIKHQLQPPISITTSTQKNYHRLPHKTSSLTSISEKKKFISSSIGKINKNLNSTFVLEPVLPNIALMNGCLSTTPKVLSRKNSSNSIVSNTRRSSGSTTNSILSRKNSYHSCSALSRKNSQQNITNSLDHDSNILLMTRQKPIFTLGLDDDDEIM